MKSILYEVYLVCMNNVFFFSYFLEADEVQMRGSDCARLRSYRTGGNQAEWMEYIRHAQMGVGYLLLG